MMAAALFRPNDLSAPATFARAAPGEAEGLRPVLAHWMRGREVMAIERLAHNDPDARHFRVTTTAGKLFVKGRLLSDVGPNAEGESRMAAWLYRNGARVPRPHEARDGALVVAHRGWGWSVYDFVEGSGFTGADGELASAALEFGRLTAIGRTWPEALHYETEAGRLADLAALIGRAATLPALDLVRVHETTLRRALERVTARLADVERPIGLTHSDYHPRNLIVARGEVQGILDFEDVRAVPLHAAQGFAAFKLIRQVAAHRGPGLDPEFFAGQREVWRQGWARSFPPTAPALSRSIPLYPALADGARYMVLLLIHLILYTLLAKDDDRFAYDLEKQLVSLGEIDVVFGEVKNA